MHKGWARAISRALGWGVLLPPTLGIPLEMRRSHLGLLGFLLAPKLFVFPGEMLWMLWNLT